MTNLSEPANLEKDIFNIFKEFALTTKNAVSLVHPADDTVARWDDFMVKASYHAMN